MKKSATPTVQASGLFHRMFGVGAGAGNSLPVRKLMLAVLLAAAATCLGVFAVAQAQAADGAMTGVTLTSGSPGTLTVSWNTPSPAPTDYRLRWAPVGSDHLSWKGTNETDRGNAYPAGDATSLTLSGLSEGTEFKVQARARYHKGEHKSSPWSGPWAEVQTRVMSQPSKASSAAGTRNFETPNSKTPNSSAPAAPNLMGAAVTPAGQVLLSWLNPADDSITGYQVLRGPDAASLVVIEEDTGSSGTSYTDTAPPAGQTHTYAVKARNATGLSPLSNTATATVPAAEEEEEEELVTAQQSSVATVTVEPAGGDFPGADFNAHETTGVVTPGTVSTGDMTAGVDRNHGQTGDYWYLDTQPGRSYRVEVKFGANPGISTRGSAGIAFLDPDGVDYASSCCESDHNRDDGATFLHFTHPSRERNRDYMVKVAAYHLYNGGTSVYNGPYEITLTDITGVKQMVTTLTGGGTVTSADALVPADGDSVDLGSRFTTGAHTDGYLLDRIEVLFAFGGGGAVVPAISLHPNTGSAPGTKLCDLTVPDRVVQSPVVWSYTPPHTFLAPDCADVTLTANTPYWIVFSDMDHVGYALRISTTAEVHDYDGSGWTIDGFAKRGASNVWSNPNWLTSLGLWAKEK